MRRRPPDEREQLPAELVTFDGHPYRTAAGWQAAFDQFHAARRQWAQGHGQSIDDLPWWTVDGECPFDSAAI